MRAQADGLTDDYLEWGQAMLTTAVFSICITAPLGAIFINTLGTKWLNYDGDVNMLANEEDGADTKRTKTGAEERLELVDIDDQEKKIETGRGDGPTKYPFVPKSEDAKTDKPDKVNEVN